MKIVKAGDFEPGEAPPKVHPDFRMIILAKYISDEDIMATLSKIPHSNAMEKFVVDFDKQ